MAGTGDEILLVRGEALDRSASQLDLLNVGFFVLNTIAQILQRARWFDHAYHDIAPRPTCSSAPTHLAH
jgi:hypothetical protein